MDELISDLSVSNLPWERFDAVLFDLDGVLTATATVHATCWKRMFDEFLRQNAGRNNEPFEPFRLDEDYRLYVDGKPRFDGVRSFLASRAISLPYGHVDEPAGGETICGLGNWKSEMFNDVLAADGVEAYEGSVQLVRRLHAAGKKTAVVTSSKNCDPVLRAAGIAELFTVRVDGKVAVRRKLRGKPAPDTFLAAAELLRVSAARSVVVEDAISGVQAGRAGKFGLVIGVARGVDPGSLLDAGADLVVADLGEVQL